MKFILDDFEQPKADRTFVDRVEPRQAFWQAFSTAQQGLEEPLVLHYYGVGGIGKTSLHSQLEKELQERCPAAKYVDLDFDFVERREPHRVMGLLKKKLEQSWSFQFPMFDVACYTFLCRIGEDGDRAEIESFVGSSQVLNFLCDATSMIPGTSMISGILKLVDEGVAVARNLFSGKKQLLRSLESMDIRQLRDQLPAYFASDIRANLNKEKQPFVIFLDTYEKLVNEFAGVGEPLQSDLWLRGPQGLIPRLPNTLWVLGGREKLKWPQLDAPGTWDNVLRQYLLGALADSDAREFLQSAGVRDATVRERIIALSDGLPVSLDLYLEQYQREGLLSDAMPSALHERVVRYMSDEEKTAVYLLAALGEWTQEEALAFAQKAGIPLSPTLLERLCGFSFILTQDGVTFHLMRKVGEVLRQHCPASLTCTLTVRKPSSGEKSLPTALDFDAAPEKFVSFMLQTFQNEDACVDWILDELDTSLMAMRKRLDLDTYFAVIGLLKEHVAQNWPGGVLETLVDGYNGIGLYYAARPEQSQETLTDALLRMEQLGNLPALYTVLEQYQYVAFCRMNLMDFVKQAEPLWVQFQQSGNSAYASRTAQLLGEAYALMDLPQKAQAWNQRVSQRGMSQPEKPVQPIDTRLAQIWKELRTRIQAEEFTWEEKDALHALVEEGRQLTLRLYGPESREMFRWYFLEGRVYTNTGDYERGREVTRELLETSRTYYGETSGTYGSVLLLDGFLRYMDCCFQSDFRGWLACSSTFAKAYPLLKANLGSENEFTRQTYILWKVTDLGKVSLKEYRERLWELKELIENPQDETNAFVLEFLDNLEYLPEELGDSLALEVISDVFGGETMNPTVEISSQPQPEEPEQPSQVTMAQIIQQLMAKYKPMDLYTAFTDIPEKKLRNALKSYGDDPKGEMIPYVLAMYDATVTGNAKNGFLLFTSGILYRESGSNQGGVTLENLEPFTTKGKNNLVINAKDHPGLASFVCLRPENAAQILNRILESLKERQ